MAEALCPAGPFRTQFPKVNLSLCPSAKRQSPGIGSVCLLLGHREDKLRKGNNNH